MPREQGYRRRACTDSAQAHGAALLGHVLLRAHQIDDAKRAVRIELGGAGAGKADDVAGELAHGHLHTQANARYGILCSRANSAARILPPGRACQSRRGPGCPRRRPNLGDILLVEALAVDQLDVHMAIVEDAAWCRASITDRYASAAACTCPRRRSSPCRRDGWRDSVCAGTHSTRSCRAHAGPDPSARKCAGQSPARQAAAEHRKCSRSPRW